MTSDRFKTLVLGGALVMAGYLMGRVGPAGLPAPEAAQAVTTLPDAYSPFMSGQGAIVSQSADGQTLYFWAPRGDHREELWERAMPVYRGYVQAR